jgi:hypothetical protein
MKLWFPQIASLGRTVTPPVIPFKHCGENASSQEKYDSLVSLVAGSAININEPDIRDLMWELHESEDKRQIFVPSQAFSDVINIPPGKECLVHTDGLLACRAAFFLAEHESGEKDLIFSHFHGTYESSFKYELDRKVSNEIKRKDDIVKTTFALVVPVGFVSGEGWKLPRKESFETCDLGNWLMSGIDDSLKSKTKKILLPYSTERHGILAIHFAGDPSIPVTVNACGIHVGTLDDIRFIEDDEWTINMKERRVPKEQESFGARLSKARLQLAEEGLLPIYPALRTSVHRF